MTNMAICHIKDYQLIHSMREKLGFVDTRVSFANHVRVFDVKNPRTRYYRWCFCDNFEWIEGESARFGLVHVNYSTQERTVKRAGEFYTHIIDYNGVTNELYKQYVEQQV